MRLYVASSWRNPIQPMIVDMLRDHGHIVYDFRHPPGGDHPGFSWGDVDPEWKSWTADDYLAGIVHPIASAGFDSDFDAMKAADACVLVLPSGRSAHLEAGYFVGVGKPLYILLDPNEFDIRYGPNNEYSTNPSNPQTGSNPELMYRMATIVTPWVAPILDDLAIRDASIPPTDPRDRGVSEAEARHERMLYDPIAHASSIEPAFVLGDESDAQ